MRSPLRLARRQCDNIACIRRAECVARRRRGLLGAEALAQSFKCSLRKCCVSFPLVLPSVCGLWVAEITQPAFSVSCSLFLFAFGEFSNFRTVHALVRVLQFEQLSSSVQSSMRCSNLRPGLRPLLKSRLQNSKFRIQHPESRIQNQERACGRKCRATRVSRPGRASESSRASRASGADRIPTTDHVLAAHIAVSLCRMAAE